MLFTQIVLLTERERLVQTVAVVNHKGGVGKTTTAVCLSGALVEQGKRMLLIDLDPQASASKWLARDDTGRALVETLLDDGDLLPLVCQTPSGIDLIPCGVQFAGFDRDAGGEPGGEFFLRQALERLPADTWDFVLLDCPPSLNLTSVSALVAADVMLVPVEAKNKYPPAKPEVLRWLAPQRGLIAIAKSKPKTEKTGHCRLPELSNFGSPPAEPGVYPD